MRIVLAIAAGAMLVPALAAPAVAADKLPGRQIEERPFGGPPPRARGLKRNGKKCKTEQRTCALDKEDVVGNKCACPENTSLQGKVVE
jgi:hypothetical protein